MDHELMKSVLEMPLHARQAMHALGVRLVVAEQPVWRWIDLAAKPAEFRVMGLDGAVADSFESGPSLDIGPGPGITEPELRKHMDLGRLRPTVVHGQPHQDVVRGRLGVFHKYVKVTVVIEHTRIEQLVLVFVPAASTVRLDQLGIGELPVRVLVEHLQIGMRGRGVEVVVQLLDVLAVVPFAVGQPEQPLLQDGVAAVP
jgi:hypothetical protein